MDATTKSSGPKDQQAQAHRGHKAWKEPRSSQKNMDVKHRSKQSYTCIKGNDINPLMQAQTTRSRSTLYLRAKTQGKGVKRDKKAIKAQGIASNMQI